MRLGGMHLNIAYIASIGKLYGDGGLLSMLVDSDEYAPATSRLVFEGKPVSRGNRGMKLMLEAMYRLYQEAFCAWMQQRDQTDLRRNDMDKLVFASGDRESARLLSKQLESEHIATLQALQWEFTAARRMQSATFACVMGDVNAGSGYVAATSESRAGCSVRTASHRRLRDHSLVSSCRLTQLRQIFAWMSEWYVNSTAKTTKVLPISARFCCTAVFQAIQCRCY